MRISGIGGKGVSGKVITIVISLVIAIIALVLLWGFLSGSMPFITKVVENIISGIKKMFCDQLPWLTRWMWGC